jgi:hypothetical protein
MRSRRCGCFWTEGDKVTRGWRKLHDVELHNLYPLTNIIIVQLCVSGHHPSSCFYLKHTTFRRLDSVSIFGWNLLTWAQSMELDPISGHHQSQRQSYFTTGGLPPISSSWRQAPWDSRPVTFQLNTCGYSPYVTSSLTWGWVCRLQLLLVLILRSESRGTHTVFYCFRLETPQTWRARSP